MSWRRPLAAAAAFVVACAVAAFLWLRSLFHESGVSLVPSVAVHLGARSILAVFPHPDDEIKAAGLLADATRRGVTVRLLIAARGDRGMASAIYPRASLSAVRAAEVRRHAAALGVREVEVWGYGDSTLSSVEPELVRRVGARIRAWHPDTIVTFDPGGGYTAHPDHQAVGRAVTAAFCDVEGADAPRWLVYALAPRGVARRFGGERGRIVAAREPPPALGMRVAPQIKVRGWKLHASQYDYVRRFAHMPPWVLYRFLDDTEYYAVFNHDRCRAL